MEMATTNYGVLKNTPMKWAIESSGDFGYFVELFIEEQEARERLKEHLVEWVLEGAPIHVEGDDPEDLNSATRILKADDPRSYIILRQIEDSLS